MERIKTIETRSLCESAKNGGCGECQTSCQSACKTSCGVANQQCEKAEKLADRFLKRSCRLSGAALFMRKIPMIVEEYKWFISIN